MLKNILVLTTDFDHPFITRTHFLVRYLAKKGIDTRVINIPFEKGRGSLSDYLRDILTFPRRAKELNAFGATLHLPPMPRKFTGNIGSIINIFQLVVALMLIKATFRTIQSPVVVAVGPLAGFVANFSVKHETQLVYEDTDVFADLSKGRIQGKIVSLIENQCMRRASLVVSVSELMTQRALTMNPRSVFISNGVDLSQFKKRRSSTHGLSLIYVGSLVDWSGLNLVFEAFPSLIEKNPRITLRICGDGEDRPKLEKMAETKNLKNNVFFLGRVPNDQVPDLLLSADVGIAVFKPKFATVARPLKLFEYMAAGLPVVATNVGQLGRTVRSSGTGLCVNWDKDEFVDAVQKLLTDNELWITCHNNGLRYVKKYDWDALVESWIKEVEDALHQGKRQIM